MERRTLLLLISPVLYGQGEDDDESEEDADYAPDARGASDAESSSDSDVEGEDSDDGGEEKPKRRVASAPKKKVSMPVSADVNSTSIHFNRNGGCPVTFPWKVSSI